MINYQRAMRILHGSKSYDFDDTKLTIVNLDGEEMRLDFENMTKGMYEKISNCGTSYHDAMRILRGATHYEFGRDIISEFIVLDDFSEDKVRMDLSLVTEEMYEELVCEEDIDDDIEDDLCM